MYVNTPWKYGTAPANNYITPELGNRFLKITDSRLDETNPEKPIYVVELIDLQCEATLIQRYYLMAVSKKTGKPYLNKYTQDTLHELARALAGPNADFVPNPADIIGGIVIGAVESDSYVKNDGSNGVSYKVNHYFPAPQEWVVDFSEIADRQYFEGCDDMDIINGEEDSGEAEEEAEGEVAPMEDPDDYGRDAE